MATKREMVHAAHTELFQLHKAWDELFIDGKSETRQEDDFTQDIMHMPLALARMLREIVGERVEGINKFLNKKIEEDLISLEEATEAAMDSLVQVSLMIGHRMFRLGQFVNVRVPYSSLTPCLCSTIGDDAEAFLKIAAEGPRVVEGNGWVINDYGNKGGGAK